MKQALNLISKCTKRSFNSLTRLASKSYKDNIRGGSVTYIIVKIRKAKALAQVLKNDKKKLKRL